MLFVALAIGVYGYHRFEKMYFVDAFSNAAMIYPAWVLLVRFKPKLEKYLLGVTHSLVD